MWIFDEKWWPSQAVAGKVPPRYAAKRLEAATVDVEGPRAFEADGYGGDRYIAAVAGQLNADGKIEGDSLGRPGTQHPRRQARAGRSRPASGGS